MKNFIVSIDPQQPPPGLEGAVVAIGNFDGLHRGHRGVFLRAQALARRLRRPCAVLTFEPHPSDYFAQAGAIFRLTPQEAKATLLARLGLDGVFVFTFNAALAGLSAAQFVETILIARLGVSAVVVGYDFHFGARRQGTPDFLQEAGRRWGFAVEIVERIAQDESGSLAAVSSTATRNALSTGDVALAARLLGHPWSILGEIIHGRKVGRAIGFPTANIALDPSCRLRRGIYAVRATFGGVTHDAVASFGSRPTFDNGPPLLEVFVFDFAGDLYGKRMEVAFIDFIREEAKFDSVDSLIAQMNEDVLRARAILAKMRD